MNEQRLEAQSGEIGLPKGLEHLGHQPIEENLEIGQSLFETSEFGFNLDNARIQVEDSERDLIAVVAGNRRTVAKEAGEEAIASIQAARQEKQTAKKEEKTTKHDLKDLEARRDGLQNTNQLLAAAKGRESLIVDQQKSEYRQGIEQAENSTTSSLEHVENMISNAREAIDKTRKIVKETKHKYKDIVAGAVRKLPELLRKSAEWLKVQKALDLIGRTEEILPQYKAGLVAVAKRIIREAGELKPLKDTVFRQAEDFDKIQEVADQTELKLARQLDNLVESQVLKKEGRFTVSVIGQQERDAIWIKEQASLTIETAKAGIEWKGHSSEAKETAASSVRTIVEKPGPGKKPIGSVYLTRENLESYEEEHQEELLDPFRKFAFSHIGRTSVEEALGCKVKISGEAEERKIDFELLSPEDQEQASPLFQEITHCEEIELRLRLDLSMTDSTNITKVKTIVEALKSNDKERTSLLKLADARINSIRVADGVRTGALKTVLAEGGVKAAEGVVAACVIYGVAYRYGMMPRTKEVARRIEEAQRILAAPEERKAIWEMVNEVAPEIIERATSLDQAVVQKATEVAKTLANETAIKSGQVATYLRQILELDKLITKGPEAIDGLMQEVETIRKLGLLAALTGGALSMREEVRKGLGAPVRGLKARIQKRFGGIVS